MYAGQKVDVGLHHADFQNVRPFLPCHGPEESAEKSGEGGVDSRRKLRRDAGILVSKCSRRDRFHAPQSLERGVEDRCVAKPRRAEQGFNHEGT